MWIQTIRKGHDFKKVVIDFQANQATIFRNFLKANSLITLQCFYLIFSFLFFLVTWPKEIACDDSLKKISKSHHLALDHWKTDSLSLLTLTWPIRQEAVGLKEKISTKTR